MSPHAQDTHGGGRSQAGSAPASESGRRGRGPPRPGGGAACPFPARPGLLPGQDAHPARVQQDGTRDTGHGTRRFSSPSQHAAPPGAPSGSTQGWTLFARDPQASEAWEGAPVFITSSASQPGAGVRPSLPLSTLDSGLQPRHKLAAESRDPEVPGRPEPGRPAPPTPSGTRSPGFSSADFWQRTDPAPAAAEPGPCVGRRAGTSMPGFGGACSSALGLWGERAEVPHPSSSLSPGATPRAWPHLAAGSVQRLLWTGRCAFCRATPCSPLVTWS